MRIIYRLSDRTYLGEGAELHPADGEGVIELDEQTNSQLISNIRKGDTVVIDAELNVTTIAKTANNADIAFKAINLTGITSGADLSDAQVKDLVYALALDKNLIS